MQAVDDELVQLEKQMAVEEEKSPELEPNYVEESEMDSVHYFFLNRISFSTFFLWTVH